MTPGSLTIADERRRASRPARAHLRRRFHEILEHGPIGDRVGRLTAEFIFGLILINLIAAVIESVPQYEARYHSLFVTIELVSLVVFTVEYGLRIWVAAEHAPHRHLNPGLARLKFICSPFGVIDLLAVLPFWLVFAVPIDLRVVLVFRVVRFLKLTRYSPGMRSLLDALYSERRTLFGCLVILSGPR
jgi:voltage-gated potassium channel